MHSKVAFPRRHAGRKRLHLFAILCTALSLRSASQGQSAHQRAASANGHNSGATKQETFQFIRGQILGLSPNGFGSVTEVSFDNSSCALKMTYGDTAQAVINFANLDANSLFWSVTPVENSSDKFLRIILIAAPGTAGEITFFNRNSSDTGLPQNQAVIDFSLAKAAQVPDVQEKLARPLKHLITLCGGTAERTRF